MLINDAEKRSARSAEARRRIARAAALDDSAANFTDTDAAVIFAGVRAALWIDSGMHRAKSTPLIDGLCAKHGVEAVLHAAIEVCASRPPAPAAWMRHACRKHSAQPDRPITKGEKS